MAIKGILYKSRQSTNKNKIELPYRNGILHGRDLGYANRGVAVKCWALLFAVRDFLSAKDNEQSRIGKHHTEEAKSIVDIQRDREILENQLYEVIVMDSFKRHPVIAGIDYPVTGEVKDYRDNSPEEAIVAFLGLWKNNNYGEMSKYIYKSDYITKSQMAGRISKTFKNKSLKGFVLLSSLYLASCKTDINVSLSIALKDSLPQQYEINLRILYCEADSTKLVVNPNKMGVWRIVDNFMLISDIGGLLEFIE